MLPSYTSQSLPSKLTWVRYRDICANGYKRCVQSLPSKVTWARYRVAFTSVLVEGSRVFALFLFSRILRVPQLRNQRRDFCTGVVSFIWCYISVTTADKCSRTVGKHWNNLTAGSVPSTLPALRFEMMYMFPILSEKGDNRARPHVESWSVVHTMCVIDNFHFFCFWMARLHNNLCWTLRFLLFVVCYTCQT